MECMTSQIPKQAEVGSLTMHALQKVSPLDLDFSLYS
jgi:hypothetical protein